MLLYMQWSGGTYSRADLEMGRIQPGEGCLCCPLHLGDGDISCVYNRDTNQ